MDRLPSLSSWLPPGQVELLPVQKPYQREYTPHWSKEQVKMVEKPVDGCFPAPAHRPWQTASSLKLQPTLPYDCPYRRRHAPVLGQITRHGGVAAVCVTGGVTATVFAIGRYSSPFLASAAETAMVGAPTINIPARSRVSTRIMFPFLRAGHSATAWELAK